jgi:hypothetical protein
MTDPTPTPVPSIYHRRDIHDLLTLLAVAHSNLDARGVPRTRSTP